MGDEQLLRDIGNRVCIRRKELYLTQEQVADKMDVSLQMISNLELGKKAIRPENLVKLCSALGTSADYILTGRSSDTEANEIASKFNRLSSTHQHIIGLLIDNLIQE